MVTVAVILGVLGFASEPAFAGNTRFVWPASGTISQTAAEHWGSEHQYGVDIIGGGTVLAAADGRVV